MEKTGNELIAEFLDWKLCESCSKAHDEPHYQYGKSNWEVWYLADLKFESSWDWLMPVVEKIESTLCISGASEKPGWDFWNDQFDGSINTDIKTAYLVVIEFIMWHNL